MTSNHASSTSAKPTKQSHSVKLTPLAMRCEKSAPVASAVYLGTSKKESLVAMLFADNTIHAYDATSLASIGPVIDFRAQATQSAISFINESTVVTGGADGCLLLANVRTGRSSLDRHVHFDAVISIDSWQNRVAVVDRGNMLILARFMDGKLNWTVSKKLLFAPLAVKLAFMNGVINVVVARGDSPHLELYSVDDLNRSCSLSLLGDVYSLTEHRLVDITVNESRTLLAAAFDNASCLKIMTGALSSFGYTKRCVTSTGKGVYRIAKVNWSTTDSRPGNTTEDWTVNRVEVGRLTEAPPPGHSERGLNCLQEWRPRTCTQLADAFEKASCVNIANGGLIGFVYTEGSILTGNCGVEKSKLTWSTSNSRLWITNNDGNSYGVDFAKISEPATLSGYKGAVVCLQVCRVGDREVIITGGRNGEVVLWN